MKSKFVKLVTVSLATSILLTPTQRAFGLGAESQTNIQETHHQVHNLLSSQDANSRKTQDQNQGRVQQVAKSQQSEATHAMAAASPTNQSSQSTLIGQIDRVLGSVFITLVFMYVLLGLQYRRYQNRRAAILLQQIETLERIWNMKP